MGDKSVNSLALAIGVLLSGVFVSLEGILGIQKSGLQAGGLMGIWSNSPVWVTGQRVPLLPMLAMAVVGTLVAIAVLVGARNRPSARVIFLVSFVVTTIVLVIWGVVAGPVFPVLEALETGLAPGLQGWIYAASKESVVHLVLLLAIVALVIAVRSRGSGRPESTPTDSDQPSVGAEAA